MPPPLDDRDIILDEKTTIPWFKKHYEHHLDKTTLIFGPSGTGKSTMIEDVLFLIKDFVPNYIIVAPRTSDAMYRRKLPARCIKEDLTKEKLIQIWNRQCAATQIYNTANDIVILESLFSKYPDRESTVLIEAVKMKAATVVKKIEAESLEYGKRRAQMTAIEELKVKKIKELYKEGIRKNKQNLEKMKLTENETIALKFLDFNPRLCMVIDDSSEKFQMWMKYFKKGEPNVFESIFYRGRWNFITLIFAAHDDKIVNTELRKNARVTMYMTSQTAVASTCRPSSGFSKEEKKTVEKIVGRIFSDDTSKVKLHQKLCYIKDDPHAFQYTIAELRPDFSLCSESVKELIAKMPKRAENLAENFLIKELISEQKKHKFEF